MNPDFCHIYQISDISYREIPDHPTASFTAWLTYIREVSLDQYLGKYLVHQRTYHILDTTTNMFVEVTAAH